MWADIGDQLRQAREAAGLTLEELRNQTQIDIVSLKALEDGDFDKISSPFYVRSYIRTYAKKVGLEPTKLLKKYRPIQDQSGTDSQGAEKEQGRFADSGLQHTARMELGNTGFYREGGGMETHPGEQRTARFDTRMFRQRTAQDSGKHRAYSPNDRQTGDADPYGSAHGETQQTGPYDTRYSASFEGGSSQRNLSAKRSRNPHGEEYDPYATMRHSFQDTGEYDPYASHGEDPAKTEEYDPYHSLRRDDAGEAGYPEEETLSRTQRYQSGAHSLSRTRSMKAVGLPVPVEQEAYPQVSRRRKRPSSQKSGILQRGKEWVTQSRWARLAVAAVILMVPVTVWGAYSMMDSPEKAPASKQQAQDGQEQKDAQVGIASETGGGDPAQVVPVNQGSTHGISEYELSQPGDVQLKFSATDTSWIQIRENKDPNGGYLKDITLKPGEEFPFIHPKNVTTDLWITLGVPQNVKVTINGQEVEPTKTIHIKKQ